MMLSTCQRLIIFKVLRTSGMIKDDKGNQNEFLKHPKIKWLDGGHEPPTSGFPVHCSTT